MFQRDKKKAEPSKKIAETKVLNREIFFENGGLKLVFKHLIFKEWFDFSFFFLHL